MSRKKITKARRREMLKHALTWCDIGARKLRQAAEVIALANKPILAAHYDDHARMIEDHAREARAELNRNQLGD